MHVNKATTQKRKAQDFTWKLLIGKNHREEVKLHYNSQIHELLECVGCLRAGNDFRSRKTEVLEVSEVFRSLRRNLPSSVEG